MTTVFFDCHFQLKTFEVYLEEKFCAFFHDLLDLKEASSVHEEKLVSHCHAEATCVAESQNLLKALRLHSRWKLDYSGARLVAVTARTVAAVAEEVPEIRAAGSQNSSMSLRPKKKKKKGKVLHWSL